MRKSVLIGLIAVVIVLAGLITWYITAEQSGQRDGTIASTAMVMIALWQPLDTSATLLSTAVVEIDDHGNLSVASIPPKLRVRFPSESGGSRFGTLDELFRSQDLRAVREATGNVMDLDISYAVAISTDRLGELIDAVGGVELDPIDRTAESVEATPVLNGEDAIAQLLAQPRGGLVAMAFEQSLLLELVGDVREGDETGGVQDPFDAWTEDGTLVTNLTAVEAERLVTWMASVDPAEATTGIIPTVPGDAGAGVEPLAIDTARMVARLFHGTEFLSPEQIRVAVFNGNGTRQLATLTGAYLAARGFDVVRTSNAESYEYDRTYVVFLGDETKAAMLHDVLPSEADVVRPEQFEPHYAALAPYVPVGTDVLVVLGAGFTIDDSTGAADATNGEEHS